MLTAIRTDGAAAWITLDDGKVNAMSSEMLGEISARLSEARGTGRPVVIKGCPGIYSAGFDMKTFARGPEASRRVVLAGLRLIQDMLAHPRPIITICTGDAYPVGAFLMLSADVRFGAAGAWNIGMNEVAVKLRVPQFAIALARHRLTPAAAGRVSATAMFTPEGAVQAGYLDRVVEADRMDSVVSAEIARLQSLDWASYEPTKWRLNEPVIAAIEAASAAYQTTSAN